MLSITQTSTLLKSHFTLTPMDNFEIITELRTERPESRFEPYEAKRAL